MQLPHSNSKNWGTAPHRILMKVLTSLGWLIKFIFYSLLNVGRKQVDMAEQARVKGRLALITGASGGYESPIVYFTIRILANFIQIVLEELVHASWRQKV